MLTKDQICRKFLDNPKINPEKGTGLRRGYGPFNKYVDMCRELGYDSEVDVILGLRAEPTNVSTSTTSTSYQTTVKPVIIPKKLIIYRSKFLTGLPETDQEVLKHVDLETLKNWIIEDPYIEKLVIEIFPAILQKYSYYDKEEDQNVFRVGKYSFPNKEYDITDFAEDLLIARKLKLVKMMIDYFNLKDRDFEISAYDEDFYARLLLDINPASNFDYETYFKLAPKNVDWVFLETFLEPVLTNYPIVDIHTVLIGMIKAAKKLKLNDLIKELSSNWKLDSVGLIEDADEEEFKLIKDISRLLDNKK